MQSKKYFDIIKLPSTDSTQKYLMDMDALNPLKEFTVIYTTYQTNGKGQGNHKWESEKDKNICFSILLQPEFIEPCDQFLLTKIISLSIVDVIKQYINDKNLVKIKWPNDIYIGLNKIGGILINNKIIGNIFSSSYIGIGININQTSFKYAPNPTSLCLETSKKYDLDAVLDEILISIYNKYTEAKYQNTKNINEQYKNLLLFRNLPHQYIYKNQNITAKIQDVTPYGHIIFETNEGNILSGDMSDFHCII